MRARGTPRTVRPLIIPSLMESASLTCPPHSLGAVSSAEFCFASMFYSGRGSCDFHPIPIRQTKERGLVTV